MLTGARVDQSGQPHCSKRTNVVRSRLSTGRGRSGTIRPVTAPQMHQRRGESSQHRSRSQWNNPASHSAATTPAVAGVVVDVDGPKWSRLATRSAASAPREARRLASTPLIACCTGHHRCTRPERGLTMHAADGWIGPIFRAIVLSMRSCLSILSSPAAADASRWAATTSASTSSTEQRIEFR
jgi:hypothetical protein